MIVQQSTNRRCLEIKVKQTGKSLSPLSVCDQYCAEGYSNNPITKRMCVLGLEWGFNVA